MQTLHSKKVNRIRSWLARNTKNLVVRRSRCRECGGIWLMARVVSTAKLQSAIHRPGTGAGRDAKPLQPCYCSKRSEERRSQGQVIHKIWYDDPNQYGRFFSGI